MEEKKALKVTKKVEEFLKENPEIETRLLADNNGKVYVYFPIEEFIGVYKK